MKTKKAGFTLVELLVVISVIAVLLAILLPSLHRAKEGAKRQVCANQLKQVGLATHAYAGDNDYRIPTYTYPNYDDGSKHPYLLYRQGNNDWIKNGKLRAAKVALLYEGNYIAEPEIFYCPSNRMGLYKYESYSNPPPWGSLPQDYNTQNGSNQWVRMGYCWFPTDPRTTKMMYTYPDGVEMGVIDDDHGGETANNILALDPHVPYMTDTFRDIAEAMYYPGPTTKQAAHQVGKVFGLHALFSDDHVVFCNEDTVFKAEIWQYESQVPQEHYVYRIMRMINP